MHSRDEEVGPEFGEDGLCWLETRDGHAVSLHTETWQGKLLAARQRVFLERNWSKICEVVRDPDYVVAGQTFRDHHCYYRWFDDVDKGSYSIGTYLLVVIDAPNQRITSVYDRRRDSVEQDLRRREILWRRQ